MGIGREQRTAILRVIGEVYGERTQITRETAANVVLRENRYPYFPLDLENQGVEIDLRGIPGELDGDPSYWASACRKIDEIIEHKVGEAIRANQIGHLSLFAIARLPLLVYLGSKLDDTFPVALYQRHRVDESWDWKAGGGIRFSLERPAVATEEAVLILNVSGIVDRAQLPEPIATMPVYAVAVADAEAGEDILSSRAALAAFEQAIRRFLASLEAPNKTVRRLHVIAALPVSGAIVVGRAHNSGIHPDLVLYARAGSSYRRVMEIA